MNGRLIERVAACALGSMALVALVAGCSSGRGSGSRHVPPTTTTVSVVATTTTIPRVVYRVRAGDTLSAIARRFRVSVAAIVARNHLTNPDRVAAGTSLEIPPPAPLALVVTPPRGHAGDGFMLELTGAAPGETITFTIQSPRGKFVGRPHTAAEDGSVSATYQTAFGDRAGVYQVTALGSRGTVIRARFRVFAARF